MVGFRIAKLDMAASEVGVRWELWFLLVCCRCGEILGMVKGETVVNCDVEKWEYYTLFKYPVRSADYISTFKLSANLPTSYPVNYCCDHMNGVEKSAASESLCDVYLIWEAMSSTNHPNYWKLDNSSLNHNCIRSSKSSIDRVGLKKEGAENLAADYLSRLENLNLGKLTKAEIQDLFPKEQLMMISDKINKPWFLQINELDELRLDAYESSISYKERTKRWHDKRIKTPTDYEKGDNVLLFNSRLRLLLGRLKSRWYGPFIVSRDMKGGVIELRDKEGNEFIVNKQRVIFDEEKPGSKKAYLLENKQIPNAEVFDEVSFYTPLGWHLEEIHVTWTQFRKKQTRIQLYTKLDIKRAYRPWRRRRNSLRQCQKAQATKSGTLATASEAADLKEALEDSHRCFWKADGVAIKQATRL
ncbi:hypothetical protein Tco_0861540 [Tanacetum coccineum]|uniref:Uncharacterized protein n=1 Tax=Tanacetum coccineum TaxID=301880 RepID=A0ABQ5BIX5_9ASTR